MWVFMPCYGIINDIPHKSGDISVSLLLYQTYLVK